MGALLLTAGQDLEDGVHLHRTLTPLYTIVVVEDGRIVGTSNTTERRQAEALMAAYREQLAP